MADDVDTTSDRIETETRRRIEAIQHEAPIAIPTGHCLECDEPVPSGHRWCGPDCRDMWCARNDQ